MLTKVTRRDLIWKRKGLLSTTSGEGTWRLPGPRGACYPADGLRVKARACWHRAESPVPGTDRLGDLQGPGSTSLLGSHSLEEERPARPATHRKEELAQKTPLSNHLSAPKITLTVQSTRGKAQTEQGSRAAFKARWLVMHRDQDRLPYEDKR